MREGTYGLKGVELAHTALVLLPSDLVRTVRVHSLAGLGLAMAVSTALNTSVLAVSVAIGAALGQCHVLLKLLLAGDLCAFSRVAVLYDFVEDAVVADASLLVHLGRPCDLVAVA